MSIDVKKIKVKKGKQNSSKENNSIVELLNKDIAFGKKGLNDKKKERFYSKLWVLVNSGIDLASALDIIVKQEEKKNTKVIFENILNQLIKGDSFSDALKNTGIFSDYEYYSIMIGEESGTLVTILSELAQYYKTRVKQRRQITGALTYPILVMFVAFGAVIFMLNVIVPMFAGVFQRFGGELPPLTQKVVKISEFFSDNMFKVILFIGFLLIAITYIKRFEFYRKVSSAVLLKTPIFGPLVQKVFLSRFCNTLQLLVSSKAPIIDALDLIGKMIRFYPLNKAIAGIRKGLAHGKSMYECMTEYAIFDMQLVSLIKVGEETGKLEQILKQLYEQYSEEVEHSSAQLGSLLEPLLIIVVGLLVMVILIAMYLPLFQLSTSIV